MISYMHPNSATMPPTLSGEAMRLYRAAIAGQPAVIPTGHYAPGDLRLLAARLACDEAAAVLRSRGVEAQVVSRDADYLGPDGYWEAAVRIGNDAVDADAAHRVAQRIEAGLSLDEALRRTLEQCERPTLSGHALRELERDADAHVQRVLATDKA